MTHYAAETLPNSVDRLICVIERRGVSHPHGTQESAFLTMKLLTLTTTTQLSLTNRT